MTEGRRLAEDGDYKPRVPPDVCCRVMATNLAHDCEQGEDPFECPDNVIYWSPPFDEYGLVIHDGGASYLVVEHCPWCGTKLPESKRDLWFTELQALGFAHPLTEDIPEPYTTDAWYRRSGLPPAGART